MRILLSIVLLFTIYSCSLTTNTHSSVTHDKPLLDFIFSDNVVLQKNQPVNFWGWTDAKQKVKINFDNKVYNVTSNRFGKWTIKIPVLSDGPFILKVTSQEAEIVVNNIVLGEVWICAGQSNMQWPLSKSESYNEVLSDCCSDFRYRKIYKSISDQKVETFDKKNAKNWWMPTNDNCGSISGVAYHFAQQLVKNLTCPLGILEVTYSDSRIEPWLQKSTQLTNPTSKNYNDPSVIYNAMMAPLRDFPVSGIVWYQGESNNLDALDSYDYRTKLTQLIKDYKNLWGEELRVVVVQLPNYESIPTDGNSNWAILRESQATVINMEGVTTVSTIDLGEPNILHPRDKQNVGYRAALAAESLDQTFENLCSGPIYKASHIDGNQISIEFSHIGEGLVSKSEKIAFSLLESNGKEGLTYGIVKNNKVVIDLPNISSTKEIQYAWDNNPQQLALYNKAGYPASSFRIRLN